MVIGKVIHIYLKELIIKRFRIKNFLRLYMHKLYICYYKVSLNTSEKVANYTNLPRNCTTANLPIYSLLDAPGGGGDGGEDLAHAAHVPPVRDRLQVKVSV